MAQIRASRPAMSSSPAPEAAPSLIAAATSSIASPIMARRPSTVEHMIETIGQPDLDRDGFRPLRTPPARPPGGVRPRPGPPPLAPRSHLGRAALTLRSRPGQERLTPRTPRLRRRFSKLLFAVPRRSRPAVRAGPPTVDNFAAGVDGEAAEIFSAHRPWTA